MPFNLGLGSLFPSLASDMPSLSVPRIDPVQAAGVSELQKADKRKALDEAMMMAGAALLGSAGSGKFGQGMSQALALGLQSYKQSLLDAQKLRDDQEQRMRQRELDAQRQEEAAMKRELFPVQKRQAEVAISADESRLSKEARDEEREQTKIDTFKATIRGLGDDSRILQHPKVVSSGMADLFKAARDSGDDATAAKVLGEMYSLIGDSEKSKEALDNALKLERVRQAGDVEVAKIRGDRNEGLGIQRLLLQRIKMINDQVNARLRSNKGGWDPGSGQMVPAETQEQALAAVLSLNGITPEEHQQSMQMLVPSLLGQVSSSSSGAAPENYAAIVKTSKAIKYALSRIPEGKRAEAEAEALNGLSSGHTDKEVAQKLIAYYSGAK